MKEKTIQEEIKKYWYKNQTMRDVDKRAIEKAISLTLAEVKKKIDEMLKEGLGGRRHNFMINGEELKKSLRGEGK